MQQGWTRRARTTALGGGLVLLAASGTAAALALALGLWTRRRESSDSGSGSASPPPPAPRLRLSRGQTCSISTSHAPPSTLVDALHSRGVILTLVLPSSLTEVQAYQPRVVTFSRAEGEIHLVRHLAAQLHIILLDHDTAYPHQLVAALSAFLPVVVVDDTSTDVPSKTSSNVLVFASVEALLEALA